MAEDRKMFAVGSAASARSQVFSVWHRNSEVYAALESSREYQKYSFHTFNEERNEYASLIVTEPKVVKNRDLEGRKIEKVTRKAMLPAGAGGMQILMHCHAPRVSLSHDLPPLDLEGVIFFPPPKVGERRIFSLAKTNEDSNVIREYIEWQGGKLLLFESLKNGENYFLATFVHSFDFEEIYLHSPDGDPEKQSIITEVDLPGRPRNLSFMPSNKADSYFDLWLMTGYVIPTEERKARFPNAQRFKASEIKDNTMRPAGWRHMPMEKWHPAFKQNVSRSSLLKGTSTGAVNFHPYAGGSSSASVIGAQPPATTFHEAGRYSKD